MIPCVRAVTPFCAVIQLNHQWRQYWRSKSPNFGTKIGPTLKPRQTAYLVQAQPWSEFQESSSRAIGVTFNTPLVLLSEWHSVLDVSTIARDEHLFLLRFWTGNSEDHLSSKFRCGTNSVGHSRGLRSPIIPCFEPFTIVNHIEHYRLRPTSFPDWIYRLYFFEYIHVSLPHECFYCVFVLWISRAIDSISRNYIYVMTVATVIIFTIFMS